MKKIIAALLIMIMFVCCFSLPCMASDSSGVRLVVEYSTATKTITLSGRIAVNLSSRNWITYYLLNPGKTRDDIPNHTDENPVFSSYGEIDVDDNGDFKYDFVHTGDPGVYNLYFTANNVHLTREIDTTSDVLSESSQLEALRGLPTSFKAPANPEATVKELFKEKVDELPSEMPVVESAKIEGLTNVFVDVKNGDDSTADGSIEKPYKTINKALENNNPESGMVLYLREGTYPMSDRLNIYKVIADEDFPFIVSNYENEEVTVVGGTAIDADKFGKVTDNEVLQKFNPDIVSNIRVVDLKEEYGITSYGDITTDSAPALYVGESKYNIARWPNGELTSMRKYEGENAINGVIDTGNTKTGGSGKNIEFCIDDIRPFSWVNTGDIWVYGRFFNDWTVAHLNVTGFNPETRSIKTTPFSSYSCKYDEEHKFYYYNVLEELDAPGEWFIDKETGKLYIYPAEDLLGQEIIYTASTSAVWTVSSCENVIINGIKFEASRGRPLSVDAADGVVVQNCSFENLGNGVYIQGKYSGVINSTFKNIEAKGVFLNGSSAADRKNLIPSRLFVQNNTFYNTKGIQVSNSASSGVGEIISHNFISNNNGSCISVVSNEAIIEYNEIVSSPRTPVGVTDSGAIYVQGSDMFSRGNHVRYNYIHDAYSEPRAIYFDDMQSECYAYGNIIANGGWMQIHTGSENTVYNNIFINTVKYSVNIGNNYYVAANSGADSWRKHSLEYSLMTNKLKPDAGYGGTGTTVEGPYAERYPLLKSWAELMYERIAEYEANQGTTEESAINAAKSSDILSEYTDKNGYTYNLNEYLSSCRDNYVENNVLIDSNIMLTGVGDRSAGFVRTVCENNHFYSSDSNPFAGKSFSDETAYDTIRERNANFETIPFEKIGLVSEEYYVENAKTQAVTPINTTEVTISANDLVLSWQAVTGAQEYTVEIASDENFTDILESATTYDLSYNVQTSLESDTVYYWRVSTKANAKCSTGAVEISDTFKFKTLVESNDIGHNQVGVTVYSVDDMSNDNFNVTTYAYNTTESEKDATIHIACYSEDGRLISTKSEPVTIQPNEFTSEYVFNITSPNTKKIKLFVWSADGNMIPYTFVKTIK